ncbi:LamG domain-containing protein [Akkermansiaceae bacterium]|nr:LamG domain-containing protein [Akkermansiaceae bacterium]
MKTIRPLTATLSAVAMLAMSTATWAPSIGTAFVAMIVSATASHAALVVHYDFENNVNDQSGNGNNGTLGGAASYVADSPFPGGNSLSTTTDASSVDVGAAGSLTSSVFTLAYWIRATNNQNPSAGLERLSSRGGDSFETAIGDANVVGGTTSITGATLSYFAPGLGAWQVTNAAAPIGNWVHVAWVNDANMTLYLDGVSVYTGTAVANSGSGALRIASRENTGPVEGFDGAMDDFRFYDTPLSATEIASLATIPEPSSALLIATCGLVTILRRRRS